MCTYFRFLLKLISLLLLLAVPYLCLARLEEVEYVRPHSGQTWASRTEGGEGVAGGVGAAGEFSGVRGGLVLRLRGRSCWGAAVMMVVLASSSSTGVLLSLLGGSVVAGGGSGCGGVL